jgi:hypothetical protein
MRKQKGQKDAKELPEFLAAALKSALSASPICPFKRLRSSQLRQRFN